MRLGMYSRHVGEKGGVRKFKKARGVIGHAILDAWVIKDRGIDEELSRMKRAEAEEVRHHQVYRGGLLRAPGDGGSVVRP